MRTSLFAMAVVGGASALPQANILGGIVGDVTGLLGKIVDPLPLHIFADTPKFVHPLSLEEARAGKNSTIPDPEKPAFRKLAVSKAAATCSNPRVRTEWEDYPDTDRQAFTSAVQCLMGKPANGQFSNSKSRYEDMVALHQTLTPNVHGSAKFLIWHRYYLWTFEQLLRDECGFDRNFPWFDETKFAGRFAQSSIFSSQWFGSVNVGGNCVTDGKFANLALNVGPGPGNSLHCLARNNDDGQTINTGSAMVDACQNQSPFSAMASCAEGGAHAWGHNGIGAVMLDTYGSPGDPVFWLHHAFIDRNFRIWQNADSSRVNVIDGSDKFGNPLTLDTNVNMYGIRPDVKIRDILNTVSTTLCYKYNY